MTLNIVSTLVLYFFRSLKTLFFYQLYLFLLIQPCILEDIICGQKCGYSLDARQRSSRTSSFPVDVVSKISTNNTCIMFTPHKVLSFNRWLSGSRLGIILTVMYTFLVLDIDWKHHLNRGCSITVHLHLPDVTICHVLVRFCCL